MNLILTFQNKWRVKVFFFLQLLFLFSLSLLEKLDVMLDDINFEYCKEGEVPAGGIDNLSCDFEKDTCAWYNDYRASLLWEKSKGGYDLPTGNGE